MHSSRIVIPLLGAASASAGILPNRQIRPPTLPSLPIPGLPSTLPSTVPGLPSLPIPGAPSVLPSAVPGLPSLPIPGAPSVLPSTLPSVVPSNLPTVPGLPAIPGLPIPSNLPTTPGSPLGNLPSLPMPSIQNCNLQECITALTAIPRLAGVCTQAAVSFFSQSVSPTTQQCLSGAMQGPIPLTIAIFNQCFPCTFPGIPQIQIPASLGALPAGGASPFGNSPFAGLLSGLGLGRRDDDDNGDDDSSNAKTRRQNDLTGIPGEPVNATASANGTVVSAR